MRTNPKWEHGVHRRFRGWAKEHGDLEVVFSSVLHPVDFFLETAFFVFVPKVIGIHALLTGSLQAGHEGIFLFKEVLRNK